MGVNQVPGCWGCPGQSLDVPSCSCLPWSLQPSSCLLGLVLQQEPDSFQHHSGTRDPLEQLEWFQEPRV